MGTHRTLGVIEEDFSVIWDPELLLRLGAGTVNTRGSLGRVATHEPVIACH